jgi:hypothetical protein
VKAPGQTIGQEPVGNRIEGSIVVTNHRAGMIIMIPLVRCIALIAALTSLAACVNNPPPDGTSANVTVKMNVPSCDVRLFMGAPRNYLTGQGGETEIMSSFDGHSSSVILIPADQGVQFEVIQVFRKLNLACDLRFGFHAVPGRSYSLEIGEAPPSDPTPDFLTQHGILTVENSPRCYVKGFEKALDGRLIPFAFNDDLFVPKPTLSNLSDPTSASQQGSVSETHHPNTAPAPELMR